MKKCNDQWVCLIRKPINESIDLEADPVGSKLWRKGVPGSLETFFFSARLDKKPHQVTFTRLEDKEAIKEAIKMQRKWDCGVNRTGASISIILICFSVPNSETTFCGFLFWPNVEVFWIIRLADWLSSHQWHNEGESLAFRDSFPLRSHMRT